MSGAMDVEGCPLPDDRLYDLENELWVRLGPGGDEATVGILAAFASFIGKVHRVEFRTTKGPVDRGRGVAIVESTRYTGAVRMPLDGRVVEVNPLLTERPKWINDDPYGRGWVFRATSAASIAPGTAGLESAAAIADRLAERIRARHVRCWPAAPDVELIEVGAECAAVLAALDEELTRRAPEEYVLLVTDDPTSPIELVRWSDRTGQSVVDHRSEGALHQFLIRKEANPTPRLRGADGRRPTAGEA
jgi:glycine cleavage system H protein